MNKFFLALVFIISSAINAEGVEWTIMKGSASTGMDSFAANELKRYLEQITGNKVPIITDTETPPTDNIFLVGKVETNSIIRDLAVQGLIKVSADVPGPEGFINKALDANGKHYVVLAGCDELGIQYAVYDFLENYCKVGFLLDGDHVPSKTDLKVTKLDVSKKPYCSFRQHSAYGKSKLWYGAGTWIAPLITDKFELDGYRTGWKDFVDWMIKKKQNVLYFKRGSFNIGYILGFPELNNPDDIASIDADRFWYTSKFSAENTELLIAYGKSRGMKTCYTATICRIPKCFQKCIEDRKHPCYGLKYEDMGSWLRLDPLDDRSYTYCLRKHVDGIISKFGRPDFWWGYYGWSEKAPTMGLSNRSQCHYKAYDLVFRHTGGSLLVYTWDWGWHGISRKDEWAYYKGVMPKDGSVILAVNDLTIPDIFLLDPNGLFAGFPWSKYLTATQDDQCLPEQFRNLNTAYHTWKTFLDSCATNPPCGFGLDNMIHHVDQRLTDFECIQSFDGNANAIALNDYLYDYTERAYGNGPYFIRLLQAQQLWVRQHKLTIDQVEQYMVSEWFWLKDNIIFRTDLTEAIYYEASDHDKCALIYGKWIYSDQFTKGWADASIPDNVWVNLNKRLWESLLSFPSDMTYENKASLYEKIEPGLLTIRLKDEKSRPIPNKLVHIKRGYLTKIESAESFALITDKSGAVKVLLKPDVYEIMIKSPWTAVPVLMLHDRDKTINITLFY